MTFLEVIFPLYFVYKKGVCYLQLKLDSQLKKGKNCLRFVYLKLNVVIIVSMATSSSTFLKDTLNCY